MWFIQGTWDQDPLSESAEIKLRLLKPEGNYGVGRKNQPLILNNKKVSSEHCVFRVAKYSADDVVNPDVIPALNLENTRDKSLNMRRRGNEDMSVNGKATMQLQDGDEILLAHSIRVIVYWKNTIYLPRPSPSTLDSCASLGLKILQTLHPSVDHHITQSYSTTPQIASSLLGQANFVKIEWLNKLIETTESDSYIPLPLTKYRPTFTSSLPQKYKNFSVWEPDERRRSMFGHLRFLYVCEKERDVDSTMREFIARGQGALEIFVPDSDVSNARTKWHNALKRGSAKGGKTLVLVVGGEQGVKAAVGQETWKMLEEEAKSYNKRFFTAVDLIHAVLDIDTSVFKIPVQSEDQAQDQSQGKQSKVQDEEAPRPASPLPSYVPNSIPEELTMPSPTQSQPQDIQEGSKSGVGSRPALKRRKPSSRQPSAEPSTRTNADPEPVPMETEETQAPEENTEPAPARRRLLRRRVKDGVPIVTGLGDSSVVIDAANAAQASNKPKSDAPEDVKPVVLDLSMDPAPAPSRTSKLKRRRPGDGDGLSATSAISTGGGEEEPAYKKYKALFEATNDPDQADLLMSQLPESVTQESYTQSQSLGGTSAGTSAGRKTRQKLGTVLEESSTQSVEGKATSKKRKVSEDADEDDVDMAGIEEVLAPTATRGRGSRSASVAPAPAPSRPPPSKKQAIENVNAVESSQQSAIKPKGDKAKTDKDKENTKGEKSSTGAGPDTDQAFLKAVASTKRGKKNEDEFDREFNNLRISKPKASGTNNDTGGGGANPEDEWAILDQFGEIDRNIRGNFMVIVETDVWRDRFPDKGKANEGGKASRPEWEGATNFKKFKKKNITPRTKKIELVVSENHEYSLGNDAWKADLSEVGQSGLGGNTDEDDEMSLGFTQKTLRTQKNLRTLAPLSAKDEDEDEDEDEEDNFSATRLKAKSTGLRAGSTAPARKAGSRTTKSQSKSKSKSSAKSQPLFLNSDDDEGEYGEFEKKEFDDLQDEDDDVDMEETLRSTAGSSKHGRGLRNGQATNTATSKRKPAPIVVDDDSDEDAFRGFKSRRRR